MGTKGYRHSPETIALLRAINLGKKMRRSAVLAMVNNRSPLVQSEDAKAKISKARLGKKHSASTKCAIAASNREARRRKAVKVTLAAVRGTS